MTGAYVRTCEPDGSSEKRSRLANRQVVAASSEGYKAKADCDKAIDLIKKLDSGEKHLLKDMGRLRNSMGSG
jgi:uncharacterized protein YegP (UPF0339 family)